ncbi:MIP family Ig-specific serine endopeptidase [Mycoplasma sp. CSL7503-lung]|uniref:MIP family Ig-specific serine endopeptidase n=1 Tax=Mycoplasma sp. CSL7503-lung TaxID=536372 RepID=UPI0021D03B27|nr:hypothetical protein [Mycoplasma sp. CSL7503-lung]MCU4706808.1 hypothetical protein [Mycoplasma sp. CSL7503-lung]
MKKKILLSMISTVILPTIAVVSCSQNKYNSPKKEVNKKDIENNDNLPKIEAQNNETNSDTSPSKTENSADSTSSNTNAQDQSNTTNSNDNEINNPGDTSETQPNNNNGVSGENGAQDESSQPNMPEIPQFDANFFNNLRKKDHQYSMDVSKYTKPNEQDIYKEIYDRTFAIKFGVNLGADDSSFLATSGGTAWLLDYHKQDENKYKLFLATNLHVIGMLSNTLEEKVAKQLNYEDERGFKANSISIGKSSEYITDFTAKSNNFNYAGDERYRAKWLTNNQLFTKRERSDDDASRTEMAQTDAISKPKLIFAGYDFMNHEYINKYQQEVKRKTQERFDQLNAQNSEDINDKSNSIWALNNTLQNDKYIPFYTDFAVFEIDVDFSKMDQNYSKWFKDAIDALDQYIDRNKKNITPNQDKSVSTYTLTTDYISAMQNSGENLTNAKDVYIGGYPALGSSSAWSRNNPVERNSDENWYTGTSKNSETFGLPARAYEEKMTNNNFSPYTEIFGKTLADFYGFTQRINFSSLYYGASGSVVYNEFGQIIGAYSGVSSNVEYGDLSKSGSFTPLLLSNDYTFNNDTIKAYNLIDGTDKTKYSAQTASYRENLSKVYPNGFEVGKKDTAIFTDGY